MNIDEKIIQKAAELEQRYLELEGQSNQPDFHRRQNAPDILKEMSRLRRVREPYKKHCALSSEIAEFKEALAGTDADMKELALAELPRLEKEASVHLEAIKTLLLTEDASSDRNVIVEIRGGTGGDEAALFAANLFRMYCRFSEKMGWKLELMEKHTTDLGGVKEVIFNLTGSLVNKYMKFESGGHRVQRVPETEQSGRIHTSAATVAVLPEPEEVDVNIQSEDIRIDVMRASGAGGQHVNKTESAVRMTHLETGIQVYCQEEKSQLKNRARAMKILRARLFDYYQAKLDRERRTARQSQIGSGDRSERIRTYNYSENRCTDHRIGLSLYSLDRIMEGDLEPLFEKLLDAEKEANLQNL